jgi:hypothetical protein
VPGEPILRKKVPSRAWTALIPIDDIFSKYHILGILFNMAVYGISTAPDEAGALFSEDADKFDKF